MSLYSILPWITAQAEQAAAEPRPAVWEALRDC